MNVARIVNLRLLAKPKPFNYASFFVNNPCESCLIKRDISTVNNTKTDTKTVFKENPLKKLWNKLPIPNVEKSKIMTTGYLLYEQIADKLNYIEFIKELKLPDTFYTWFVITELHVWMLSVRAMAEGEDGKMLRNHMMMALWADTGNRVKKLGNHTVVSARNQISELHEQLMAALIAYDEGLQSSDIVLAAALWRRMYQHKDVDPIHLDRLVKYVRINISLLDLMSRDQLLVKRQIAWTSLKN